jgi:hypothetical protein
LPIVANVLEKERIRCKNRCEWEGTICELKPHLLDKCKYSKVFCSFPNCNFEDFKENIFKHEETCDLKPFSCLDCFEHIPSKTMNDHLKICLRMRVACVQDCDLQIPRGEMEDHIENFCQNTLIKCSYYDLGCDYQIIRKEYPLHNENNWNTHIDLLLNELENTHLILEKLKEEQEVLKKVVCKKQLYNNNYFEDAISLSEASDKENKRKMRKRRTRPQSCLDLSSDEEDQCQHQVMPIDKSLIQKEKILQMGPNRAICISREKAGHCFVFADFNLCPLSWEDESNLNDFKWKVYVYSIKGWIAFGVAIKEVIIQNKFKFNSKTLHHGCFMISSNKYYWNSNDEEQNYRPQKSNFPEISDKEVINFKYKQSEKTLEISWRNSLHFLFNVYTNNPYSLVPCVILTTEDDDICFLK